MLRRNKTHSFFYQISVVLLCTFLLCSTKSWAIINLKLPWTVGEPWICTAGYGPNGGSPYHTGTNYYALDFDKSGVPENGPDQPILAAASGTVSFAGLDNYGYGYTVKIDHGDDYVTRYSHLRYNPSISGYVSQGQQIGIMGGTGNEGEKVWRDHLHFALYHNGACRPEPMSSYTNFVQWGSYTSDNTTPRGWSGSSVIDNVIFTVGGGTCEGVDCGMFGSAETSVVEAYNTSTSSWVAKSSLQTARFGLTASAANGKIYAIGGTNGNRGAPVPSVEEYNPSSDGWLLKATMPTPRWKLTSSVVDGLIYTIGGGATGNQCSSTKTVEKYNPINNTWETKNPMPTSRWGAASAVLNSQIYVVGGSCACPHIIIEPSSALEVYTPSTDIWTVKTSMPTARWDLAAATANGKIYAIGGWDPYNKEVLQVVEEYNPVNDTWATKSSMPTARTGLAVAVINGQIYAFGGFNGSKVIDTIEIYNPVSDTWSQPQTTCPECSGSPVVLTNVTFNSGRSCECSDATSITISSGVIIKSGANITFKAPRVNLKSGFHAENGSVVRIKQQ